MKKRFAGIEDRPSKYAHVKIYEVEKWRKYADNTLLHIFRYFWWLTQQPYTVCTVHTQSSWRKYEMILKIEPYAVYIYIYIYLGRLLSIESWESSNLCDIYSIFRYDICSIQIFFWIFQNAYYLDWKQFIHIGRHCSYRPIIGWIIKQSIQFQFSTFDGYDIISYGKPIWTMAIIFVLHFTSN